MSKINRPGEDNNIGDTPTSKDALEEMLRIGSGRVELCLETSQLNKLGQDILVFLNERIEGHDEQKLQLAKIFSRVGKKRMMETGALGAAIMAGPSGVGKNGILKALAEFFFGDPNALIRFDCGKVKKGVKCDLNTIFGTNPGYVNHEVPALLDPKQMQKHWEKARQRGTLHPSIRSIPDFAIIVFDEVDAPGTDIIAEATNQIIDEDEVVLNKGEILSTRNLFVAYTTNLGQRETEKILRTSPDRKRLQKVKERSKLHRTQSGQAIRKFFAPKFLGRTQTICFGYLDHVHVESKVEKFEQELNEKYARYGIEVDITPELQEYYISMFEVNQGMRPIIKRLEADIVTVIEGFIEGVETQVYLNLPEGVNIGFDLQGREIQHKVFLDGDVSALMENEYERLTESILISNHSTEILLLMYYKYAMLCGIDLQERYKTLESKLIEEDPDLEDIIIFFDNALRFQEIFWTDDISQHIPELVDDDILACIIHQAVENHFKGVKLDDYTLEDNDIEQIEDMVARAAIGYELNERIKSAIEFEINKKVPIRKKTQLILKTSPANQDR